jgi:transposase
MPDDVYALKQLVHELHDALQRKQRENDQLSHRLQQLLKARFGPRADRLNPNQLILFATEIIEKASEPAPVETPKGRPPSNRNGHGRRKLPADLPRQQVVHDLPDDEKRCPCCGEARVRIGQETSEQLEFEPATLYVIEHVRPTYACKRCEGNVTTASKPLQPIEKGLAGPGLLAQVITSKYGDHLPLYRQEQIFKRSGQSIPRSTTCGWMASCAALVKPLVDRMKTLTLQSKVIHTDDTPVPVLEPKRGKTRTGRLWVYVGDHDHPYTVFDYTPTRGRDGPANFFGDYAGYIQADAYGGYDHLFKPKGGAARVPTEVGCWAHARRKFVEAEDSDPMRSHTAAAMIRLLYEVEAEARDLDAASRCALRREKSLPRLEQIKTWFETQRTDVLPKSPMGQAISYCLSNWSALTCYVSDGDLAIDNNAAENAMRPVALGRKNWLFAGSNAGGQTGATLMSLVASCKRHSLDPFAYLRDVLRRLPDTPISQLDPFLPDLWKAEHLRSALAN